MILFYLIGGLIGLFVALLIMAVVLRAACYCVGVKEPELFPAMGVVFLVALCAGFINFVVGFVIGATLAGGGQKVDTPGIKALLHLIGLGVNTLVAAGFYSSFLKNCTFGKGALIYLLQLVIIIAIVLAVAIPLGLLSAIVG